MTTAVIYLERSGNNPHFARQFLDSMRGDDAGAEFQYVHLLKGFKYVPDHYVHGSLFRKSIWLVIPDEKYTLASIRPVIEQLPHDKFLFFHSFSKILAPQWLGHYLDASNIPGVGIVGATGSRENGPHIRTNAFMVDRKLFLELMSDDMTTREQEAAFESGPNSLTNKIINMGLNPVVIDRHGVPHFDFGASANIFRRGFQEDLLVADNRTIDYDVSPQDRRCWLSSLAWGMESLDHGAVPTPTVKQQVNAYISWHYDM